MTDRPFERALVVAWMFFAFAFAASPPRLIEVPWDDLGVFTADLRPEVGVVATTPSGASIYHLLLTIEDPTHLTAQQEVRYINRSDAPLHDIYFQLLPNLLGGSLEPEAVRLDGEPVESALERGGRLLRVALPTPLPAGAAVTVALDYRLTVPTEVARNYGVLSYRDGVLSLAHAYALLAVHDDDGWDLDRPAPYGDLVYAESSFYLVRVDAPAELTLVGSGRELDRRQEAGRQLVTFAAGPVRDLYLVALEGMVPLSREVGGVTLRAFTPAADGVRASLALDAAAAALSDFDSRLTPYPYRELDFVVLTTSALGIEFPGIIALSSVLFDDTTPTGVLEGTTVHEVAHQWFYGLVGNDQLSEPWLDESLTQYATLRYFGARYGPDGYRAFRDTLEARWSSGGRLDLPIGLAVADYSAEQYGAIVYGLGPLVIERLAAAVGEATFDAGLRDYVERYRFGVAHSGDFEAAMADRCGCDLAPFFAEWITPHGD